MRAQDWWESLCRSKHLMSCFLAMGPGALNFNMRVSVYIYVGKDRNHQIPTNSILNL